MVGGWWRLELVVVCFCVFCVVLERYDTFLLILKPPLVILCPNITFLGAKIPLFFALVYNLLV